MLTINIYAHRYMCYWYFGWCLLCGICFFLIFFSVAGFELGTSPSAASDMDSASTKKKKKKKSKK